MRIRPRAVWWLALLPALLGCQSPSGSKSGALASVTIAGANEARVRVAAIRVFEQHGFAGRALYEPEMVFERRGTLGNDLLRGGWLSGKTVERVRVRVIREEPSIHRLDCNACVVQYPGDRVMEEEFRIRKSSPYQELLAEVSKAVAEMRELDAQ